MAATDGAKLIPAELAQQGREPRAQVGGKLGDEAVLAAGDLAHLATEEPTEVEEPPRGGDDRKDRCDGRHRGRRERVEGLRSSGAFERFVRSSRGHSCLRRCPSAGGSLERRECNRKEQEVTRTKPGEQPTTA
jgi:hypothetical protein